MLVYCADCCLQTSRTSLRVPATALAAPLLLPRPAKQPSSNPVSLVLSCVLSLQQQTPAQLCLPSLRPTVFHTQPLAPAHTSSSRASHKTRPALRAHLHMFHLTQLPACLLACSTAAAATAPATTAAARPPTRMRTHTHTRAKNNMGAFVCLLYILHKDSQKWLQTSCLFQAALQTGCSHPSSLAVCQSSLSLFPTLMPEASLTRARALAVATTSVQPGLSALLPRPSPCSQGKLTPPHCPPLRTLSQPGHPSSSQSNCKQPMLSQNCVPHDRNTKGALPVMQTSLRLSAYAKQDARPMPELP